MLKSSARLIANVRGRRSDSSDALYEDSWSRLAAGRHGELLGDQFLELMPALGEMVESRTRHADDALRAALVEGVKQVVLVGAGLDFRPFRIGPEHSDVRWFELDLPEMLRERERVLGEMDLPDVQREGVPLNLDFDDPVDALRAVDSFDADAPAFVIYEGCSMYFEEERAHAIFARLARLVRRHSDSRLWMDLVAPQVVGGDGPEEIRSFVDGMARMGEPFVFGHDDPQALFEPHELRVEGTARSDHYRKSESPLFPLYYFVVLAPTDRGARVPHRASGS